MTNDPGLSYSQTVMQRPPQLPSILSARQSYQWSSRINQQVKELAGLKLSPKQKAQIKNWLEVEFVFSTLRLEDSAVSREAICQIIHASADKETAEDLRIEDLLYPFQRVEDQIESAGQKAELTVELLLSIAPDKEFRQTDSNLSPVRAAHLPRIVENACRWFAMASFAELNPIEQAAIALLRLLEIVPFERHNQRTSLIAASLFLLRSELPPLIFKPEQDAAYTAARREGLHLNTQPMVELIAASVEQTLAGIIKLANS
ncbi:MAG: Fic family protein [Acidobacteria bacterium]|nr:Fic family protein [Acidobacteriota bacterium]